MQNSTYKKIQVLINIDQQELMNHESVLDYEATVKEVIKYIAN